MWCSILAFLRCKMYRNAKISNEKNARQFARKHILNAFKMQFATINTMCTDCCCTGTGISSDTPYKRSWHKLSASISSYINQQCLRTASLCIAHIWWMANWTFGSTSLALALNAYACIACNVYVATSPAAGTSIRMCTGDHLPVDWDQRLCCICWLHIDASTCWLNQLHACSAIRTIS